MLEIGDQAPQFSLLGDDGNTYTLSDFTKKTLILYFYPKDMTSGCTQQACDLRDAHVDLQKKGAVIVGVSKDSISLHQKFRKKYDLPFLLLSDPEATTAKAYGIWKEKSLYGRKYMGMERTTFVISKAGKILGIHPKVRVAQHLELILRTLESS